MNRVVFPRLAICTVILIAVGLSLNVPAFAAPVDVVVDSADIQLESGDGGEQTAKVTIANLRDAKVNLAAVRPRDEGCTITPDPAAVEAGRRTQVTLTIGAGCEVKQGANVTLRLTPSVTPSQYVLKLAPAKSTKPHWNILIWSFLIGAGVALVLVSGVAIAVLGRQKLKWGTELTYLGTSWSFKDNWVGNVTIGSAALVGLLAASNILKAVLGAEPEAALALLAVASALATVFVAVGPLFVKVIGDHVDVPTIGGTLSAGLVTLLGTFGQISAVTWQGAELTSHIVKCGVIVLGVCIGAVVAWYAIDALAGYATKGATPPPAPTTPSEVMQAAAIIAAAIRNVPPPLPPSGATPGEPAVAPPVIVQLAPPERNALL